MQTFKSVHITINRACNLRCDWCYAADTKFLKKDDMSIDTFNKIYKFIDECKINKVILIGGEPTVFDRIFEFIKVLKGRDITLVTNGVLLSDRKLCEKYIDSGVARFSVSIKAATGKKYKQLTHGDKFNDVLKAISNLTELAAKYSVSWVITEDNVDDIPQMVKTTGKYGADKYFFSVCRNFNLNGSRDKSFTEKNDPYRLAQKIEKLIPWLKANGTKFSYAINDPICTYDQNFLDETLAEFSTPCYVHTNSSLTFDTDGSLIPCNTIHQIKIGKIGEDFSTLEEYLKFEQSEKYRAIYKILRGLPDDECKSCQYLKSCYGRCVCNWTNYTFKELKGSIKEKYEDALYSEFGTSISKDEFLHILQLVKDLTGYKAPEKPVVTETKIILGQDPYPNSGICVKNNILYQDGIAFIVNKTCKYVPHILVCIYSLLFGSHDKAIVFIKLLKRYSVDHEKVAEYLFYEKGIILVNARNANKVKRFSLSNYANVKEVLVLGCEAWNILKPQRNPCNVKSGKIMHPSPRNVNRQKYLETWGLFDDNYINPNYGISFKDFHVL